MPSARAGYSVTLTTGPNGVGHCRAGYRASDCSAYGTLVRLPHTDRNAGPIGPSRESPQLYDLWRKSGLTAMCHIVARRGTFLTMADHYTLRLAPGMRQRLTEWARRAGLPERTLAQRYLEEGLRHDAHPLIQFLDGPSGRRASLLGRGPDVWEVIATIRDNDGSIARAAEYLQLPAGLVEAAVAYYGEYRDEIDNEIELNDAEYERGRAAAAAGEQALRW